MYRISRSFVQNGRKVMLMVAAIAVACSGRLSAFLRGGHKSGSATARWCVPNEAMGGASGGVLSFA